MTKEFEFFIVDIHPKLLPVIQEKSAQGVTLIGSVSEMLLNLSILTLPQDDVSCRISGGCLDMCVARAVESLLAPEDSWDTFKGRTISQVIVDLTTSVASVERSTNLSIEDRRKIFIKEIGEFASDARLTILPKVEEAIVCQQ